MRNLTDRFDISLYFEEYCSKVIQPFSTLLFQFNCKNKLTFNLTDRFDISLYFEEYCSKVIQPFSTLLFQFNCKNKLTLLRCGG